MTAPDIQLKILSKVTVTLGKSPRRGTRVREGFRDEANQVFIPPAATKRLTSWRKKMEDKGYLIP